MAYLGLGVLFSGARPQSLASVGTPWCFDDWCLTLAGIAGRPSGDQVEYTAALTLSSGARRVRQRARGAWVCVLDEAHQRYAAEPDPTEP